jgi:hypothetical protein
MRLLINDLKCALFNSASRSFARPIYTAQSINLPTSSSPRSIIVPPLFEMLSYSTNLLHHDLHDLFVVMLLFMSPSTICLLFNCIICLLIYFAYDVSFSQISLPCSKPVSVASLLRSHGQKCCPGTTDLIKFTPVAYL